MSPYEHLIKQHRAELLLRYTRHAQSALDRIQIQYLGLPYYPHEERPEKGKWWNVIDREAAGKVAAKIMAKAKS